MAAIEPSSSHGKKIILPPDGRQTRIDFFQSDRKAKGSPDATASRKSNREWWQVLTGWMRSTRQEKDRKTDQFAEHLASRGYTQKTIESYIYMLKRFFDYLDNTQVEDLSFAVIEDYNYDFFVSGRYSRSYQLQFINALTLYLEFAEQIRVNLKGLRKSALPRK